MKYTQVAADAFKKLQLNAGILLRNFDPVDGSYSRDDIIGATGGGIQFTATPTFIDFAEDIDNVPNNTMEMKQLDYVEAKMSGTFKTLGTDLAKQLAVAADVDGIKITPRSTLLLEDFNDVWWVGDYSDITTGEDAGYLAVRLINAISSGGFQIQSNDKGKGDFSFEYTANYSLEDVDKVPYELYVRGGGKQADATLASLTVGNLTLTPSFDPMVTEYTAETTTATNGVSVTATDSAATIVIKNGDTVINNGGSATWEIGENTLTITVTNDDVVKVYTVVVTKEE